MRDTFLSKSKNMKRQHVLFIVMVVSLILPTAEILFINSNTDSGNRNYENLKALADQISPTPAISLPAIFRDEKNGTALSIQTTSGQFDTGQFYFFVPSIGYYSGKIPFLQSGEQIIHPQGTVTGTFSPLNDSTSAPATIKMEGEIDATHNNASINVWVNDTHYHISTPQRDTNAAITTIKQALMYTTTQDWTNLYNILSSNIQSTTTQTQFTQLMTNANVPTIISADLNGTGQLSVVAGNAYFAQPVILTVRKTDGTTATYHSTVFSILEQGVWRFLSTNTPTP